MSDLIEGRLQARVAELEGALRQAELDRMEAIKENHDE